MILDIQIGETNILRMHWSIIKNKDIWTSDTIFTPAFSDMTFSLTSAPRTTFPCLIFQPYTQRPFHLFDDEVTTTSHKKFSRPMEHWP
jgi:hypothetical protein